MDYQHIEVAPLTGALGAELRGVDLAHPLTGEVLTEIRDAFLQHIVIVFREQMLTPAQQLRFGRYFGQIHRHPYIAGLPDTPDVIEIRREPEDRHCFGKLWHTDQIFVENPAIATVLYAKEVPRAGGDTIFANMYLAYEGLSPGMQEMLAFVRTHNVGDGFKQLGGKSRAERYQGKSSMRLDETRRGPVEAQHPLVRVHPETGRKGLYFSFHTQRFVDMTEAESQPILRYLSQHATRPQYTCRVTWQVGTLVMWDNRCAQHIAVDDYFGERRVMHRLTIKDSP